jgi:molybdopterin synthase sulfur carrier subunit
MSCAVRVELPQGLCALAGVGREVCVQVAQPVTSGAILDALEASWPVLAGTIRDRASGKRRPFMRFFACQQDFSHAPADEVLPVEVIEGREAFAIVGAIAGG